MFKYQKFLRTTNCLLNYHFISNWSVMKREDKKTLNWDETKKKKKKKKKSTNKTKLNVSWEKM